MEDNDKITRAIEKTHEWLIAFLERNLPGTLSSFLITLHADYDEKGVINIVIDVQASRPRTRVISEIVEEAVAGARRIFEKEAGIPAHARIRYAPTQAGKKKHYSRTRKRRSRRGRSGHRSRRDSGNIRG
ncbi:MAG: hypothetical protein GSR81_03290 [Desulfurococcales archaeon]|nr:hypothetical protein [Desulfurococcales archaeon]